MISLTELAVVGSLKKNFQVSETIHIDNRTIQFYEIGLSLRLVQSVAFTLGVGNKERGIASALHTLPPAI
ncbi:MAG: hypothetical protein JSS98_14435 [Bacteroidetes bacterium]|nr:hypothetical protein [Bacteroidota bacterium]